MYAVLLWPKFELSTLRRGRWLEVEGRRFSTRRQAMDAAEAEAAGLDTDAAATKLAIVKLSGDEPRQKVTDFWVFEPDGDGERVPNPPSEMHSVARRAVRSTIAELGKSSPAVALFDEAFDRAVAAWEEKSQLDDDGMLQMEDAVNDALLSRLDGRRGNPKPKGPCISRVKAKQAIARVADELGCTPAEVLKAAKPAPKKRAASNTVREQSVPPAPIVGIAVDTDARLTKDAPKGCRRIPARQRQALVDQLTARRIAQPTHYVAALVSRSGDLVHDTGRDPDKLVASARRPDGFKSAEVVIIPPLESGDDAFDAEQAEVMRKLAADYCSPLVAAERKRVLAMCRGLHGKSPKRKIGRRTSKAAAAAPSAGIRGPAGIVDSARQQAQFILRGFIDGMRSRELPLFDVGPIEREYSSLIVIDDKAHARRAEHGVLRFEFVLDTRNTLIQPKVRGVVRFEAGIGGWDNDVQHELHDPELTVHIEQVVAGTTTELESNFVDSQRDRAEYGRAAAEQLERLVAEVQGRGERRRAGELKRGTILLFEPGTDAGDSFYPHWEQLIVVRAAQRGGQPTVMPIGVTHEETQAMAASQKTRPLSHVALERRHRLVVRPLQFAPIKVGDTVELSGTALSRRVDSWARQQAGKTATVVRIEPMPGDGSGRLRYHVKPKRARKTLEVLRGDLAGYPTENNKLASELGLWPLGEDVPDAAGGRQDRLVKVLERFNRELPVGELQKLVVGAIDNPARGLADFPEFGMTEFEGWQDAHGHEVAIRVRASDASPDSLFAWTRVRPLDDDDFVAEWSEEQQIPASPPHAAQRLGQLWRDALAAVGNTAAKIPAPADDEALRRELLAPLNSQELALAAKLLEDS